MQKKIKVKQAGAGLCQAQFKLRLTRSVYILSLVKIGSKLAKKGTFTGRDLQPLIWKICSRLSGRSAATCLVQMKMRLTQPSLVELGLGLSLAKMICLKVEDDLELFWKWKTSTKECNQKQLKLKQLLWHCSG